MIRAFAALVLPDDFRDAVETLQAGLNVGREVPAENLHLTLAFFGEHPRPALEDLHLALEEIDHEPVELELNGVGMFGGASPRAIFAAVKPSPSLKLLRDQVHRAARSAGLAPDSRKFHPHITLARFGDLGGEDRLELDKFIARRIDFSAGPFLVTSFGLYRSTLRGGPPIYDLMAEYPLD
ncbi:RNA 2',3'-cyclic phosphodiesterase [Rhodobacteraceae bacterium NNCM2]|nr:RNA 2',3'-cyclic phosphodiesterase [Coraliihabitans acroporae]